MTNRRPDEEYKVEYEQLTHYLYAKGWQPGDIITLCGSTLVSLGADDHLRLLPQVSSYLVSLLSRVEMMMQTRNPELTRKQNQLVNFAAEGAQQITELLKRAPNSEARVNFLTCGLITLCNLEPDAARVMPVYINKLAKAVYGLEGGEKSHEI